MLRGLVPALFLVKTHCGPAGPGGWEGRRSSGYPWGALVGASGSVREARGLACRLRRHQPVRTEAGYCAGEGNWGPLRYPSLTH